MMDGLDEGSTTWAFAGSGDVDVTGRDFMRCDSDRLLLRRGDEMAAFETSKGAGARVLASQDSRSGSEAFNETLSTGEREDPD